MCARVRARASKVLDVWSAFSSCRRCKQAEPFDRRVAAVPKFEAVERSASRIGPNPPSPEALEELIVAVACPESTRRAQGVTLEAERTKAKSARCRGAPHHARFSVSRAFVLSRQEETKTGVEHYYSSLPIPSRKTRRAHSRRWS